MTKREEVTEKVVEMMRGPTADHLYRLQISAEVLGEALRQAVRDYAEQQAGEWWPKVLDAHVENQVADRIAQAAKKLGLEDKGVDPNLKS